MKLNAQSTIFYGGYIRANNFTTLIKQIVNWGLRRGGGGGGGEIAARDGWSTVLKEKFKVF